jgi:hypothetical protein
MATLNQEAMQKIQTIEKQDNSNKQSSAAEEMREVEPG